MEKKNVINKVLFFDNNGLIVLIKKKIRLEVSIDKGRHKPVDDASFEEEGPQSCYYGSCGTGPFVAYANKAFVQFVDVVQP